jgi:hypothetical protein
MAELRQKIVKLCKVIGGVSGMMNKIDENAPEYYSLASVVTDEQADVAIAAGLRKQRSTEYLAKKCGKSVEETHKLARELADIGVFRMTKNAEGEDRFFIQIFAPGTLEMMVGNSKQLEEHPEIARAFEEYTRLRSGGLAPILPKGGSLMRVVPIESAIAANPQTVPYERLSYYLDKYDKFSVSDCSCRATRRVMGQGCGHLEHDMCIHLGDSAEYYTKTGKSRDVTREEVEKLLELAEENGLVHEIPNIEEPASQPRYATAAPAPASDCAWRRCSGYDSSAPILSPKPIPQNALPATVRRELPVKRPSTRPKALHREALPVERDKKIIDHSWKQSDWDVDYRENRENVVPTEPPRARRPVRAYRRSGIHKARGAGPVYGRA